MWRTQCWRPHCSACRRRTEPPSSVPWWKLNLSGKGSHFYLSAHSTLFCDRSISHKLCFDIHPRVVIFVIENRDHVKKKKFYWFLYSDAFHQCFCNCKLQVNIQFCNIWKVILQRDDITDVMVLALISTACISKIIYSLQALLIYARISNAMEAEKHHLSLLKAGKGLSQRGFSQ